MSELDDRVIHIFNEMEEEYDDIADLWYAWLFSRLHYFIAKDITDLWPDADHNVLDVGCGTGFQSFLYSFTGARVVGVDIADKLVEQAKLKIPRYGTRGKLDLFPSHFPFVRQYDAQVHRLLRDKFKKKKIWPPKFQVASALSLPFDNETFSHVNCCGSVLSFIPDYRAALREISRVLQPGGTFIFEVEAKWNADLFWPLADVCLRGRLGYDCTWREAFLPLKTKPSEHVTVEYPFGETRDPVYMNIRLFSKSGLKKELAAEGLLPLRYRSIHSLTNLVPSTLLDTPTPSNRLAQLFTLLARVEQSLPLRLPGCSLVITGRKAPTRRSREAGQNPSVTALHSHSSSGSIAASR